MSASKLDAVYRSILITKFFTKGWGKPENLRRLFEFRKVVSNRNECFKLVEKDYPVTITKDQSLSDCRLIEGYFTTPLERYLPGIVPEICQKAHFQAIFPLKWQDQCCKPVCLHLAGTGDHFYWRRRNLMVKPLLKEGGIGGIILENPFYGLRKPTDQVRSSLHNVSDIFVMGGCLILESLVLFNWCERNGLGPLGVTGLSMGGHMASLAATNWPKPLVLVPCLSWSTASAVFLQGVMSHSINWDLLEDQYLSDGVYREKLSKMVTIVDDAFLAGKKFAQKFGKKVSRTDVQAKPPLNEADSTLKEKDNKEPDITYNESNKPKQDRSDNIDNNNNNKINSEPQEKDKKFDCKDFVPRLEIEHQKVAPNFREDLKKLLQEDKINLSLYEKLTSNEKFELDAQDIDDINKLSEDDIKEFLLKLKIAEAKISPAPEVKSKSLILETSTNDILLTDISKLKSTKSNDKITVIQTETKKSWNDITSDIWTNLPFVRAKSEKKIDIAKIHWRDREALQFMRGIMDECTHLSNFSVPFDTSLIIAVCAKHDAYVPREDVGRLEEIWPGAEVRYVEAGHVSAYLLHQSMFRSCILEAFERSKKRWKNGKHED